MARKIKAMTLEKQIKTAVRDAELSSGTGATGQTLLRHQQKPLAKLIEAKKIGPQELQAAAEIDLAFMVIAGGLGIKPLSFEKISHGYDHADERASIVDAQARYRAFVDHWSVMAKRGDPTLEIVIAVVIDERSFCSIDLDIGMRRGTAKLAFIRGLRDYAARAGWVDGKLAEQWKTEAAVTFRAPHPELSMALAKAAVSRSGA